MNNSPLVSIETSKEGSPVVVYEQGGVRRVLSSRTSPTNEAMRLIESFKTKPQDFVVVFGSAHLALVLALFREANFNFLFIVEGDSSIAEVTKNYYQKHLSPDWLNKTIFYTGDDYFQISQWFRTYTAKDVQFCFNRAQYALHTDFYEKAKRDIIEIYNQKIINVSTISRFERLWLQNVIKNTPYLIERGGVVALKDAFRGCMALIIGAGPSLEKHLPRLKNLQDVILIAVDTVLKTLLYHGIVPHFVVVVDPQKVNAQYVEGLDQALCQRMIFICEPAIMKSALRYKPCLLFFDTIFPYYQLVAEYFGSKGAIDLGGNVGTCAYEVARFLGFQEVGLLGLDMCLKKNTYHVRGSMYEERWFSESTRLHSVEDQLNQLIDYEHLREIKDYNGEIAYVDAKFQVFILWFEKKYDSHEKPPFFYNCGEGGYVFRNIPNRDFHDFLMLPSEKIGDRFKKALQKSSEKNHHPSTLPIFTSTLKRIAKHIEHYGKLCEESCRLCQSLLDNGHQEGKEKLLQRLDDLENQLLQPFEGKNLINIAIQKAIHTINEKKNLNPTMEDNLLDTLYLYSEALESCRLNVVYLGEAQASLEGISLGKELI